MKSAVSAGILSSCRTCSDNLKLYVVQRYSKRRKPKSVTVVLNLATLRALHQRQKVNLPQWLSELQARRNRPLLPVWLLSVPDRCRPPFSVTVSPCISSFNFQCYAGINDVKTLLWFSEVGSSCIVRHLAWSHWVMRRHGVSAAGRSSETMTSRRGCVPARFRILNPRLDSGLKGPIGLYTPRRPHRIGWNVEGEETLGRAEDRWFGTIW